MTLRGLAPLDRLMNDAVIFCVIENVWDWTEEQTKEET